MIKCGECGSTYKRKCNNGKYYWSCIEHDLSSQNCNSKPVAEEAIMQAFVSLCNKLIQHYKEIQNAGSVLSSVRLQKNLNSQSII